MRSLKIVALCLLVRGTALAGCAVPLEPTRTSFVAQVRVGVHGPFRFLVDTATSVTVVDSNVAKQLDISSSGSTQALSTTGPMDVHRGVIEDMQVGNVTRSRLPVLIAPLPIFKSHGRVDGILGMDFLAGHSVLLDIRRRCLDLDVEVTGGTTIETEEIAGRVALRQSGLNFVLDSAASFTVLTSARAAKLAFREQTIELTSAAGRQNVPSATIPLLKLGDIVIRDLPAAIIAGRNLSEDALIPVTMFSSIFIDASRRFAVLNGRTR
jgi:predicted aspartyl protease